MHPSLKMNVDTQCLVGGSRRRYEQFIHLCLHLLKRRTHSVDPDQTPHGAVSDQDLHCLHEIHRN